MPQDLTPIIVAAIGVIGGWLASRATKAGERRKTQLEDAAQERADRDADFDYMAKSRDAAIEDATRFKARAEFAEAHLAICIAALRVGELAVPDPPIPRT